MICVEKKEFDTADHSYMETEEMYESGSRRASYKEDFRHRPKPRVSPILIVLSDEHEDARSSFKSAAAKWRQETDGLSATSEIAANEYYLRIIGMGKAAIPLILEELESRGGRWYTALQILSGQDPVPNEHRGYIKKMKEDWLGWGRRNRLYF